LTKLIMDVPGIRAKRKETINGYAVPGIGPICRFLKGRNICPASHIIFENMNFLYTASFKCLNIIFR